MLFAASDLNDADKRPTLKSEVIQTLHALIHERLSGRGAETLGMYRWFEDAVPSLAEDFGSLFTHQLS
jgi:hypothetical protein